MYLKRLPAVGNNVSWMFQDDGETPGVIKDLGVILHVKQDGLSLEGGQIVPETPEEKEEYDLFISMAQVAHKFVRFNQPAPSDDELIAIVERGNPPPPG